MSTQLKQVLVQPDWEIIGFIASGYIGILIITPILLHSMIKMKNNKFMNEMKYTLMISLTSALIYCITIAFFRTNIIFALEFSPSELPCVLTNGIAYTFYIISKLSMYVLFTYRIQLVFGSSLYAVSPKYLKWMRIIILFITAVFLIPIHFTAKQEIITPQLNISLCTNDVGFSGDNIGQYIGNVTVVLFLLADFIFSMVLLWLFCSKLSKMSKLYSDVLQMGGDDDDKKESLQQIESQLIKQTILVCTGIFSTFVFAFIGGFVWWSLGWFIPLDMAINSLCGYLTYKFASKTYSILCKPCICCCRCCIKHCHGINDDLLIQVNGDSENEPQALALIV
eukprot:385614_1